MTPTHVSIDLGKTHGMVSHGAAYSVMRILHPVLPLSLTISSSLLNCFSMGGTLGHENIAYNTSTFADVFSGHFERYLNGGVYQVMCILPEVLALLRMVSRGSLSSASMDQHTR